MDIFTHGSNINFQESAQEMSPKKLNIILHKYLNRDHSLLFGTIDIDKQEIFTYGRVKKIEMDQKQNQFICHFSALEAEEEQQQLIEHYLDEIVISHEACFDVVDDLSGKIQYQVAYLTFYEEEKEEEITYFFAHESKITNPLIYVASFWEKVMDTGRDVDFSLTGCQANSSCIKKTN